MASVQNDFLCELASLFDKAAAIFGEAAEAPQLRNEDDISVSKNDSGGYSVFDAYEGELFVIDTSLKLTTHEAEALLAIFNETNGESTSEEFEKYLENLMK